MTLAVTSTRTAAAAFGADTNTPASKSSSTLTLSGTEGVRLSGCRTMTLVWLLPYLLDAAGTPLLTA